jgi:FkbM family methyltransferase
MLFKHFQITSVLDVGANRGQFGQKLREFYNGPIVSFEPAPEPFADLVELASKDKNWQVRSLALGRVEGRLELNIAKSSLLSSFLKPLPETSTAQYSWDECGSWELIDLVPVDVCRLDRLLQPSESDHLFLKVDTQGFDLEVISGAEGILDRVSVLQVELSMKPFYEGQPSYREVLPTLEGLGFEIAGLFPIVRDQNWSMIEADCVLVRH